MIDQYADMIMCLTWVIIYLLVFVSTFKSNKAAIHPMACAVIFPWEFVMLAENVLNKVSINYAFIGHVGFALIDYGIMLLIVYKIKWYDTMKRRFYWFFVLTLSMILAYIFTIPNGTLYTSYISMISRNPE